MSGPDEFRESYKVLELPVGAPPSAVRQAFRRLAKAYHPDRYSAGSTMEQHAQEKMKAINRAYEVLVKSKAPGNPDPGGPARQHPRTAAVDPADLERARHARAQAARQAYRRESAERTRRATAEEARDAARGEVERMNRQAEARRPPPRRPHPPPPQPAPVRAGPGLPSRRGIVFATAGLVVLLFSAAYPIGLALRRHPIRPIPESGPVDPGAPGALPAGDSSGAQGGSDGAEPHAPAANPPGAAPGLDSREGRPAPGAARAGQAGVAPAGRRPPPAPELPEERAAAAAAGIRGYFTVGSSRGDVLSAQGAPDASTPTTFQYGSSIVSFRNDVVESWQQGSPPLRARLPFSAAAARIGYFTLGSRKDDVVAVQGRPDASSAEIFQYGSSVVFFHGDRVLGWQEGSRPLRARRPADLVALCVGRFTLGSRRDEVVAVQGKPAGVTPDSFRYGSSVVRFDRDRVASWIEGDVPLRVTARPTGRPGK